MKKIIGREALNAFAAITPFLKALYLQDSGIFVCDTEKYIAFEHADTYNTGVCVGDKVKEGSSTHTAMTERKRVVVTVPKEYFGVTYRAVAVPIFDEKDNVIGAIGVSSSIENQLEFQGIIELFSKSFEDVTNNVQEITAGAIHLAESGERLALSAKTSIANIRKSDKIVEMISKIANQTKLLGLNAAIEAARAGEYGRGFTVVAEEIPRLSDSSNISAKQVNKILIDITNEMENIFNETQETSAVSQRQCASTEEIAAVMQQLLAQLNVLNNFNLIL